KALKVKYRDLCKSPVKVKIEQWTLEWEGAFREAKQLKMVILDKEMIAQDFLSVAKKFMPEFSTTWAVSKRVSKQKLELYKTIKEFRRSLKLSKLSQLTST